MLLINRAAFSSKDIHLLRKQNKSPALHSMSYSVICKRTEAEDLQSTNFQKQLLRSIHVTRVNRDVEGGLRALAGGIAITGVIGPGIGIGILFGSYLTSLARNPSSSKLLQPAAVMGLSFCEILGLMAVIIAFIDTI